MAKSRKNKANKSGSMQDNYSSNTEYSKELSDNHENNMKDNMQNNHTQDNMQNNEDMDNCR